MSGEGQVGGRVLGRGINFGNALEAAAEGEAGFRLERRYFEMVKAVGFDTLRLPVRWSPHIGGAPPYEIDRSFLDRVDWAIDAALGAGLKTVVNWHHYPELCEGFAGHEERFLAVWRRLAEHFSGLAEDVYFELLNEPYAMTPESWNSLLARALAVVRGSNPGRGVIVGPVDWNNIGSLGVLEIPPDDNVVVTVHYYSPMEFTHQGAHWVSDRDLPEGTRWNIEDGGPAVAHDLDQAAAWARQRGLPLFIGEFGAYEKAVMGDRAAWTKCVRTEAERRGASWAYWDFGTDFGAYDCRADRWRLPLKEALLGRDGG
jgi:endoglucanase